MLTKQMHRLSEGDVVRADTVPTSATFNQGSDPGGGRWGQLQKKNPLCQSTWLGRVAQPVPVRARPVY
jgi:hypothetical protein